MPKTYNDAPKIHAPKARVQRTDSRAERYTPASRVHQHTHFFFQRRLRSSECAKVIFPKRLPVLIALVANGTQRPPRGAISTPLLRTQTYACFRNFCLECACALLTSTHLAERSSYAGLNGAARSSEGGATGSSVAEEHRFPPECDARCRPRGMGFENTPVGSETSPAAPLFLFATVKSSFDRTMV